MEWDQRRLSSFVIAAVLAFLLYQDWKILGPFLDPLIWAAVFALVFRPMHKWVERRMPRKPGAAAFTSAAVVMLVVIAPLLLLLGFLIQESAALYPTAQAWVERVRSSGLPSLESVLPRPVLFLLAKAAEFEIDLQGAALKTLAFIGEALGGMGASVAKNTMVLLFDLGILAVSLFFFFKDGEAIAAWVLALLPLEKAHKDRLLARMNDTVTAVVRGAAATAAAQGLLAGVGFALAGTSLPVFLGFATALFALVPPFGPALVWVPAALLAFTRSAWSGLFLLLWGIFVVSLADNVLRPVLIGGKAKLPFLLLFFGILGGMSVYGFLGLVLGPLCFALTLAVFQIHREGAR
ncbi:MAG: AI-2E family transporter [Elusimicrobiota bacterium]